jgi:hypothetical protein
MGHYSLILNIANFIASYAWAGGEPVDLVIESDPQSPAKEYMHLCGGSARTLVHFN